MLLFVLLAQSKLAASIEILVMLIVAAIIGFVIAWLYYKAKCAREVAALNQQISEKEDEISKCLATNEQLQKELAGMKALHAEAVKENDSLKIELKNVSDELEEKDVVLTRIAQRKHLLDYTSFGKATEEDKDDLKIISGVGPFIEERLNALDIYTFEQVSKFTSNDVETVTEAIEFFPGRIERDEWVKQAKKLFKK